jgi:hypothetical protein
MDMFLSSNASRSARWSGGFGVKSQRGQRTAERAFCIAQVRQQRVMLDASEAIRHGQSVALDGGSRLFRARECKRRLIQQRQPGSIINTELIAHGLPPRRSGIG